MKSSIIQNKNKNKNKQGSSLPLTDGKLVLLRYSHLIFHLVPSHRQNSKNQVQGCVTVLHPVFQSSHPHPFFHSRFCGQNRTIRLFVLHSFFVWYSSSDSYLHTRRLFAFRDSPAPPTVPDQYYANQPGPAIRYRAQAAIDNHRELPRLRSQQTNEQYDVDNWDCRRELTRLAVLIACLPRLCDSRFEIQHSTL